MNLIKQVRKFVVFEGEPYIRVGKLNTYIYQEIGGKVPNENFCITVRRIGRSKCVEIDPIELKEGIPKDKIDALIKELFKATDISNVIVSSGYNAKISFICQNYYRYSTK